MRPSRPRRRSLPWSQVIRASVPRSRISATLPPRRRSSAMSSDITRASISTVAPGRVAVRVPDSLARLRAAVCESDWTVGASRTSAATIASATIAGGSPAWEARSPITASTASAPTDFGFGPHRLAQAVCRRIAERPAPPRSASPRGSRGRRRKRLCSGLSLMTEPTVPLRRRPETPQTKARVGDPGSRAIP